jgi:hypothetical protein
MANTKLPCGDATLSGGYCRPARKPYLGRRARLSLNNYVCECHSRSEACPKRLQDGFFGRKATRQPLNSIGSNTNIIKLGLDETAWNQRVARILDPPPQFANIYQINPVADDLHATCRSQLSSRSFPAHKTLADAHMPEMPSRP